MEGLIRGINHITLAVTDINKSFNFYKDVLMFQPLCKWPEGSYFLAGDLWFCLSLDPRRGEYIQTCYSHIAFSVDQSNFGKIALQLEKHKVNFWKKNVSEGDSLYILDPDKHKLEVHVGDWRSRLQEKKKHAWEGAVFYA